MIEILKKCLWKNFGASIDMLKNAIMLGGDENWDTNKKFFYNAYHCAVFLDYYLSIPPVNFRSPLPFTLTDISKIPEHAIDDVVPDRIYTKKELLDYLRSTREKCRKVIRDLTEEKLNERWINRSEDLYLELASSEALNYSVLE